MALRFQISPREVLDSRKYEYLDDVHNKCSYRPILGLAHRAAVWDTNNIKKVLPRGRRPELLKGIFIVSLLN